MNSVYKDNSSKHHYAVRNRVAALQLSLGVSRIVYIAVSVRPIDAF
jgi:hypothetical protein